MLVLRSKQLHEKCIGIVLQESSKLFQCPSLQFLAMLVLYPGFQESWTLSQLSWGEGGVTPCTSQQLITGKRRKTTIHYRQFTVANQANVRVFTCRVPKQMLEEYANSTQKDPRWQSNLWPSCSEATVPAANSLDISDDFLLKLTIHQELKTTTVIVMEAWWCAWLSLH